MIQDSNFETIILKFRLPKAITALTVGIALSLSGSADADCFQESDGRS